MDKHIESAGKITTINPVIEFDCVVNGRELTASIPHIEKSFVGVTYHVRFSDGHTGEYEAGDDGHDESFGTTRTIDAYEEAIWDDLAVLPGLEDSGRYTYVRVRLRKVNSAFNVWVRPCDEPKKHDVYYKGECQFSLRKTTCWESSSLQGKGYVIDEELAALVCRHLDNYE